MLIFIRYYFTDFLRNIPQNLLLTKCDESQYEINETLANVLYTLSMTNIRVLFNLPIGIAEYLIYQSIPKTFLSYNPWWKKLNYTKEIINQFNGNSTPGIADDCYYNITYRK